MTTKAQARGGFCVCNRPVAEHFDASNRRVSCTLLAALRSDPALQTSAATVQQSTRDNHVVDQSLRYWPLDQPLPAVLLDADLMRVARVGHSKFYLRKAAGDFTFLECVPQLPGSNTRYSGLKVRQWTEGTLTAAPARITRTFFTSAQRRRPGRPPHAQIQHAEHPRAFEAQTGSR